MLSDSCLQFLVATEKVSAKGEVKAVANLKAEVEHYSEFDYSKDVIEVLSEAIAANEDDNLPLSYLRLVCLLVLRFYDSFPTPPEENLVCQIKSVLLISEKGKEVNGNGQFFVGL